VVTRKPEGLDHHLLYYDLSKIQEFYLDDLFILLWIGVLLIRNIVETIKVSTCKINNLTPLREEIPNAASRSRFPLKAGTYDLPERKGGR
jgi:hypothetical protein